MSYFDATLEAAPVSEMDYTPVLPEERHVFELIGFERSEPDQWRKDGGVKWTFRVFEADGVKPFIFQDEQYEFFRTTGLTRDGRPNFNVGTYANEWASALLGRPLGTDADFKISELRNKRMSAMVVWEPQKSDSKKKTIKLASLRHVPTTAGAAPKRDVTTVPAEPSDDDVDRALSVQGLRKSIARLKKLDAEQGAAAQHAMDASELDTAPLSEIDELWSSVKAAIEKAMDE
jgi:hypothetical protein